MNVSIHKAFTTKNTHIMIVFWSHVLSVLNKIMFWVCFRINSEGDSKRYPYHMVLWRNYKKKNSHDFYSNPKNTTLGVNLGLPLYGDGHVM